MTPEARYGLVFAHYLAGSISLARAGELLNIPWLELRTRCLRIRCPVESRARLSQVGAAEDVKTLEAW